MVLRGHGDADDAFPGSGDGGGEAAQLILAHLGQPGAVIHAGGLALGDIGEVRGPEQLSAQPGVGPDPVLQSRDDHHVPFPPGRGGRRHHGHGPLLDGGRGQGIHRQILGLHVVGEGQRGCPRKLVHIAFGRLEEPDDGVQVPVGAPGRGAGTGHGLPLPARGPVRGRPQGPQHGLGGGGRVRRGGPAGRDHPG
ncbi:hypothetical protein ACFFX0_07525 [Citricoccus parietis]|uniref:Uncharacterized protein n=1 Tax=Citricoccus parietis TaxID=592307 RepID=A0ABV5FWM9_9MICC